MTFRYGQTLVRVEVAGCEGCGATAGPWAEPTRRVLVVVAGAHRMVDLPLCLACAKKRGRGEFAGLTPADSDRPLGGRL